MTSHALPVIGLSLLLAAGSPALAAQESQARPRNPQSAPRDPGASAPRGRVAVPRGGERGGGDRSGGKVDRARPAPGPVRAAPRGRDEGGRAVGDRTRERGRGGDDQTSVYTRPRGDRPTTGRAVGRGSVPPRNRPVFRGRTFSPGIYYYPYGFGTFGLGYYYYDPFYYDPYWWGYGAYGSRYGYYGSRYYGGGYYGGGYYDTGSVRLKVKPRDAQVYVDGYYAGVVDEYDGIFQRIRLPDGPHRIEIRADGYEPLTVDVRVIPGEKITYEGRLRPLP